MIENELIKNSKRYPNKTAIIYGENKITYKELVNSINFYSIYLKKFKKKKILLNYNNSIEWVVYYFSIRLSGNIPVLASSYFPVHKLTHIIKENKIKYIITDKKKFLKNKVYLKKIELNKIKKNIVLKKIILDNKNVEIIYTSGTTGLPKGVIIPLATSLFVAKMINKIVKLKKTTVELLSIPLSHSDGLGRLKCMALNGHTLVLNDNPNNFGRFFSLMQTHNVNGFFMVPSGIEILKKMNFLNFNNFKNNLQFIELGSENINFNTLNWLKKTFKYAKIYYHYGLTEASRSAFVDTKKNKKKLSKFLINKGVKFKIIKKNKKLCKKNEIGEIYLKGKNLSIGYVDKKMNEKFTDLGFKTGDLGKKISLNSFELKGRVDDVKKINGSSVSLKEIENTIQHYPNIIKNKCYFIIDKSTNAYRIHLNYYSKNKINENKLKKNLEKKLEYFKIPSSFKRKKNMHV